MEADSNQLGALVEATAFRTQLTRRALDVLSGLQSDVHAFLGALQLPANHAHAMQAHAGDHVGSSLVLHGTVSNEDASSSTALAASSLPASLANAAQLRSQMLQGTIHSFDSLRASIETLLSGLIATLGIAPVSEGGAGPREGMSEIDEVAAGVQGDIMREAAATAAAAERLQHRAAELMASATQLQQTAWSKV